jgi:hypothetical protein
MCDRARPSPKAGPKSELRAGVAQDVRENGEQEVGEEVDYWQTHSGDIGTGHH